MLTYASETTSPHTPIRAPLPVFRPAPAPAVTLQRKCACGGTPGPSGECEACRKKRLIGQRSIQAKLAVNRPGDAWEQEADSMAERVMADRPRSLQAGRASPGGPAVMRQAGGGASAGSAPAGVETAVQGAGRPLDPAVRSFMEPRFGHDFGQVRVHTDDRAAESARSVEALAYTTGRDIVFAAGQYAPGSASGRRLIAHELTHVIQQAEPGTPRVQRQSVLGGFPRGTNLRFDTYRITEADLSDRDILARLRSLTPDQLRVYLDRVADPAVQDYIRKLLAAAATAPKPRDPAEDCLNDYAGLERVSRSAGPQFDVFECYSALEAKAAAGRPPLTPEAGCIQCLNNSVKMGIDEAYTLCRDRLLNSCIELTDSWNRAIRRPF